MNCIEGKGVWKTFAVFHHFGGNWYSNMMILLLIRGYLLYSKFNYKPTRIHKFELTNHNWRYFHNKNYNVFSSNIVFHSLYIQLYIQLAEIIKLRKGLIIWVAKKWRGGLMGTCWITQYYTVFVFLQGLSIEMYFLKSKF